MPQALLPPRDLQPMNHSPNGQFIFLGRRCIRIRYIHTGGGSAFILKEGTMWQQSLSSHQIRYTCTHCTDERPFVGVPGHFPPWQSSPRPLAQKPVGQTVGWDVVFFETNLSKIFPLFFLFGKLSSASAIFLAILFEVFLIEIFTPCQQKLSFCQTDSFFLTRG